MSDETRGENPSEGFRIGGAQPDPAADPEADDVAPGRSVFEVGEELFAPDDDLLPHWSEPPTGAAPQVGSPPTGAQGPPGPPGEPMLMEAGADEMEVWSDLPPSPQWAESEGSVPLVGTQDPNEQTMAGDDFFVYDEGAAAGAGYGMPGASVAASGGEERDMPMAVVVGVVLAAAILLAMAAGPAVTLIVVTVALGLAAIEWLNAVRLAGYQPAVLLGLAGVVAMPLAVYWRGEAAIPVVCVLTVVFGALWYLTGIGTEGPLRGLGTTIFGVVYIGVLGSHAALLLTLGDHGTGLLTTAIIVTAGYDVGGLFVGRAAGRTPLSSASPAKTLEGLLGGCVVAVGAGVVMGILAAPAPVADGPGDLWTAIIMAIAIAIAAPIGDLAESLLKRDLGIKNMGALLPGHGGVLDRIDGLLFVLPVTYYVALIADII